MINRRKFTAALLGYGVSLALLPRGAWGESRGEDEHVPRIDLPILAEDPTAVPFQAWVDHPMESDHYIRSFEIRLETDPVPYKGKFLFTPANGRPWVAFHFRSGVGGMLRVVAECSRHGRFVGTRDVRVVEGGCTTAPDKVARERLGNPMLRLPRIVRVGEMIQVRAKVDHNSYTGLALRDGKFVRTSPEFYIKQMLVYLDDERISEFQMTSAVSPNPLIRFPLKASRSGTLRVVFVNNEGQRWEVSQPLAV